MENKHEPAFPMQPTFNSEGQICNERYAFEGLTKREYFAGLAMQSILTYSKLNIKVIAEESVFAADSLLEALNK